MRKRTDEKSVLYQLDQITSIFAEQEGKRMSSAGVHESLCSQIDGGAGHSYVMTVKNAAQHRV